MENQQLYRLCKSTCDNLYEARVRSYSGRGMYGKECIGISTEDGVMTTIAEMVRQASYEDLDMDEVAQLIEDVATDSMGMGQIIYWPKQEWPEGATET